MRAAGTIALILAGACSTGERSRPPAAGPRLVVLVVIDMLPDWAFTEKLPHMTGGLARVIAAGRRYVGEYPSAATATAPGHATLGTGASPHETGILSNDWYRRELEREVPAVDDGTGKWTMAQLKVPGMADSLVQARPASRAVGIALKVRAALLPLGQRAGLGVWYDAARTGWNVNVEPRPAWVDQLEADHPIAPRLADVWQPLDAAALARESKIADDAPGELGTHAFGPTFPHELAKADDPARAVVSSALGVDIQVEAALAAIAGAELGTDDAADYLSIGFSAHDYVAHAWGLESWETWDIAHRIDAGLGRILDELDRRVGAGRWAMIVTADHGGAPMVERHAGSRHPYADIEQVAEAAATTVAGAGDWVGAVRYPTLYLGPAANALPAATRDRMIDAIVAALRREPWLAVVERRDRVDHDCPARSGNDARLCWAVDPARSGEVVFAPTRYSILHENDEVTASHHGSLEDYDYQVPLILVAPGVTPGRDVAPVSMLRVVPTLARWLGVPPPAQATAPPL